MPPQLSRRGRDMGTGDGKRNQYFVTGMDDPQKRLMWQVRLNEPAKFDVAIHYAAGDRRASGHYVVESGDQNLTQKMTQPDSDQSVREESVGTLTLSSGEHTIVLYSPDASGRELFRPLEIQLKPNTN